MWIFKHKLALLGLLFSWQAHAQTAWTWTPKSDMPFPVSNNAVSHGEMGGETYIYSFGGIDSTKIWSGITNRSFRYHINSDTWDEIDSLPKDLPVIAASASTVNNKVYIIGGYHVESSGNEISSDEVVIYNPETNSYEANGANIPIAIDDHVQAVWKDSLIYVITGWSNTSNVFDVQIYDPALDQWSVGTSLPIFGIYNVFGASGTIIGDTIYYYGGASMGINFPAQPKLRKGIINPSDPTQISWEVLEDAPNDNYRSACIAYNNDLFWVGGSATSYNYNGVAYNGSGGVEPSFTIARYESFWNDWFEGNGSPYGVMDLRGAGQVSNIEWIICGGMESGQKVSKKTYLLTYDPVTGSIDEADINKAQWVNEELSLPNGSELIGIYSLSGKELKADFECSSSAQLVVVVFEYEGRIHRQKLQLK